jgi:hypothetical protein
LNQQFSKNIGATFVWKKLNPTFFKSDIIFPKLLDQQFLEMLPIFLKILDQQIFKISDKHFSINVEPTFHYQKVDYTIFSKKPTFFRHQHSSSSTAQRVLWTRSAAAPYSWMVIWTYGLKWAATLFIHSLILTWFIAMVIRPRTSARADPSPAHNSLDAMGCLA